MIHLRSYIHVHKYLNLIDGLGMFLFSISMHLLEIIFTKSVEIWGRKGLKWQKGRVEMRDSDIDLWVVNICMLQGIGVHI